MGCKPVLLDLFCGAGGAAVGYHRAGWDVVGVDNRPQPHYPFQFVLGDAMTFDLDGYDAIHASPPCQAYSTLNALNGYAHTTRLVGPIRERLVSTGLPYVIENVMGAPVYRIIRLCGGMFGLRTYRHRLFESNYLLMEPAHPPHVIRTNGTGRQKRAQWDAGFHACVVGNIGSYCGPAAMGIDWMTGREISQAIPPAYTEWIGKQLLP